MIILYKIKRSESTTPIYVFFIHVSSAWCAYVVGKFACKICIQVINIFLFDFCSGNIEFQF